MWSNRETEIILFRDELPTYRKRTLRPALYFDYASLRSIVMGKGYAVGWQSLHHLKIAVQGTGILEPVKYIHVDFSRDIWHILCHKQHQPIVNTVILLSEAPVPISKVLAPHNLYCLGHHTK